MTTISSGRDGNVAVVTIDKPQRRNALTHAEFLELAQAVERAGADAAVRAVVLTGAGPAFCAGADLVDGAAEVAEALAAGDDADGAPMANATAMIRAVTDCPVPVVAAVEGAAAGIGASLALACDLIVAGKSGFFTLPFGRIGLVPDGAACLTVAASLGRARAMQLAMTQSRLPAEEAAAAGLVAEVVEDGEALSAARELVAGVLAGSPREALAEVKALINGATLADLDGQLAVEAEVQPRLLTSEGHREGVAAFLERRSPDFG